MRFRALTLLVAVLGCGAASAASPSVATPPDYDVVIRGGTVYDG